MAEVVASSYNPDLRSPRLQCTAARIPALNDITLAVADRFVLFMFSSLYS